MRRTGCAAIAVIALLGTGASGQTRPEAVEPPSMSTNGIPGAGGNYVGSDHCVLCHDAEAAQFSKTVHARLKAERPGQIVGCEMCHGPGKAHADYYESGVPDTRSTNEKQLYAFRGSPTENSSRCMRCHITSRDEREFDRSIHARHAVDCNECHAAHLLNPASRPLRNTVAAAQQTFFSVPLLPEETRWLHNSLLRKPQPDLCAACHGNVLAQFALPTHHRVPEGAMKCTDCHNTHGTSNRAMLRQSGWETCVQCHVEKRGPFVFEHSAVKVEGCIICHTPHGSVNRMLLVRREERFLCLSCHVDPVAANVPHGRLGFQTRGDCTRCHSVIHGSNFNVDFLN